MPTHRSASLWGSNSFSGGAVGGLMRLPCACFLLEFCLPLKFPLFSSVWSELL